MGAVRTIAVGLLLAGIALAGELPASAKAEIEGLLAGLGSSSCEFYRNGSWHAASDAKGHLQRKYDYAAKKGMIGSAEDFISVAGTKSSRSGEAYQVRCANEAAQPSARWLTAELRRLREKPRP